MSSNIWACKTVAILDTSKQMGAQEKEKLEGRNEENENQPIRIDLRRGESTVAVLDTSNWAWHKKSKEWSYEEKDSRPV